MGRLREWLRSNTGEGDEAEWKQWGRGGVDSTSVLGRAGFQAEGRRGLDGPGHCLRWGARGRSSRWATLSCGGLVSADRG